MGTNIDGYFPRAGLLLPCFSCEEAGPFDDPWQAMGRDEQSARAAALGLVLLLTQPADPKPAGARGKLAPWQERKVDRYLRANLPHRVRVEDLARQVSLSVSRFASAFKTSFGTTPHWHIIHMRLELAQVLMLTTADPLSQIALACGLADQTHLSKLFRRELGETPGAWRRQNLSDASVQARRPHRAAGMRPAAVAAAGSAM
jgi:AraC family transcriptional regulator